MKFVKNIKHKKLILITTAIIMFVPFCYWQNNGLSTTVCDYYNNKINVEDEGFNIIQISDLHNKEFGKDNERLTTKIINANPDIIVITGDIVDSSHTNIKVATSLVSRLVEVAPVYFVTGNHECALSAEDYSILENNLKKAGVMILDNDIVAINSHLYILGLNDQSNTGYDDTLANLVKKASDDSFKILLAHEPQEFDYYSSTNVDLILSGHAHGGQWRIPFTSVSFVAPDQGFFPYYTSGLYTKSTSSMYVSRGLGNSIIPIRLFNRPEIVKITLHCDK